MNTDYIANPLYDNNPFIEALPPMLAGKTLSVRWHLSHHTATMTVTAVLGSGCSCFPLYMNIISLYP